MIKKLIERLKQSGIDVQILETTPVNSDKGRLILNDLTNMSADYILKETSLWNEVIQDPLYIGIRDYDDYIASEALARISGKSNAAKLEEIANRLLNRTRYEVNKPQVVLFLTDSGPLWGSSGHG